MEIRIPAPLGCKPYPFQVEGARFAMERDCSIIADEMGLGKTIQALLVVNTFSGMPRVLIVCPASLKHNWKAEAERWLTSVVGISLVEGQVGNFLADVVIVNFEILCRNIEALLRLSWSLVIVDEAHRVKNYEAARTIDLFKISSRRWIFLTGTPMPRSPIELYPMLHCCDPKAFPRVETYALRYCNAHMSTRKTRAGVRSFWDMSGASNTDELAAHIRKHMIRRLKVDVQPDLPPKTWQLVELDVERKVSADFLAACKTISAAQSRSEYVRGVRNLGDDCKVAWERMAKERLLLGRAKLPAAIDHLKLLLESGEKLIVFAYHQEVIKGLHAEFRQAMVLFGPTPKRTVPAMVARFQDDPDCRMFIGQFTAAGVGLNLTASSNVVFVETPWNPDELDQCADRAHRIGQTKPVLIQHLVIPKSFDSHMAKVILKKRRTIESILVSEPFNPLQEAVDYFDFNEKYKE